MIFTHPTEKRSAESAPRRASRGEASLASSAVRRAEDFLLPPALHRRAALFYFESGARSEGEDVPPHSRAKVAAVSAAAASIDPAACAEPRRRRAAALWIPSCPPPACVTERRRPPRRKTEKQKTKISLALIAVIEFRFAPSSPPHTHTGAAAVLRAAVCARSLRNPTDSPFLRIRLPLLLACSRHFHFIALHNFSSTLEQPIFRPRAFQFYI